LKSLFVFNSLSAVIGSIVTYLLGGWSALLDVLLFMVIVDYLSGLVAAYKEGTLSSKIGFIGISKKVYIFLLVAVGHKIDVATGNGNYIMQAVIWFYLANELLSITENGGRMGAPIPPVLQQAISVLKGKGGSSADKDSE
jgi:toxin secretion/phage lysis holin